MLARTEANRISDRTKFHANNIYSPNKATKKETAKTVSKYSEPGSNRYGHYCPQDFKSGVSTYSTIRATQPSKALQIYTFYFILQIFNTILLRNTLLSPENKVVTHDLFLN